jgi:hypothetical protein
MDKELFKNGQDYWQVANIIRDLYLSEGSLLTLLDFERVIDELDIYAFKNWSKGELVAGPEISKYKVSCTFMWPYKMMPDPRGAKRLLPFDCEVFYKKTKIKIPIKIDDPSDYIPGTHKARIVEKPVWLVEIVMPKNLISDIRTGSVELEDQELDLEDLDQAYEQDIDKDEFKGPDGQDDNQQTTTAPGENNVAAAPAI